jgi:hypothetical protein
MKRIALWTAVLVLPLVMGAASFGLYHVNLTGSAAGLAECCPASECCPDDVCCFEKAGYVCPITGEELSCPNCCPLNQTK